MEDGRFKKIVKSFFACLKSNINYIVITLVMIAFGGGMVISNLTGNAAVVREYKLIIVVLFILLSLVMVGVLYWAKQKKWAIEKVFLVCGLILGVFYVFAIPVGGANDEPAHFWRVYAIAEGRIFPNEEGEFDRPSNLTEIVNTVLDNGEYARELGEISVQASDEYVSNMRSADSYSPLSYVPHVVGAIIGKMFGLPLVPMVILCRLLGMITCIVIMYFCIKYIPILKKMVFMIGMLPITMQGFCIVSADGLTICAAVALVTYVLYARKTMKRMFNYKDFILLLLICSMLTMTKIVYAPLCLLTLWIPKERINKNNKHKFGFLVGLGAITLLLIVTRMMFSVELPYRYEDVDARYGFIFGQPIRYLGLIFKTMVLDTNLMISGALGGILGWSAIDLYAPYVIVSLLFFAILCMEREGQITRSLRIFAAGCVIVVTLAIYTSMYIMWTATGATVIDGVQGRYFIPILLLIPLICLPSRKMGKRELVRKGYLYTFFVLENVYAIAMIACAYV